MWGQGVSVGGERGAYQFGIQVMLGWAGHFGLGRIDAPRPFSLFLILFHFHFLFSNLLNIFCIFVSN
jgi:hypothetical protein